MKKTVTCPCCKGNGFINKVAIPSTSTTSVSNYGQAWSERCLTCKGKGTIEVTISNLESFKKLNNVELSNALSNLILKFNNKSKEELVNYFMDWFDNEYEPDKFNEFINTLEDENENNKFIERLEELQQKCLILQSDSLLYKSLECIIDYIKYTNEKSTEKYKFSVDCIRIPINGIPHVCGTCCGCELENDNSGNCKTWVYSEDSTEVYLRKKGFDV